MYWLPILLITALAPLHGELATGDAEVASLHAEWKPLGPFGGSIEEIAADPFNPGVVIAAAANGLLFRSRDAGRSWSPLPFPAELRVNLHALLIDPAAPNTYLVGVSSESAELAGVFRSRDAGATWHQLPGMRRQQVWSLAAFPGSAGVIAAGAENGLYLTNDGGESWQAASSSSQSHLSPVVSVAFDPTDKAVIYAGTPHLAWKTADSGAHWSPIHKGMQDDSDVFSIITDTKHRERLFAGACSGIYRSLDGGARWVKVSVAGGASDRTYFVAQDPSQPHIVFAGTTAGLMRSLDGGTTWQRISSHAARGLAFDTAHPGRIFVATAAGVLRSDDGGRHLFEVNEGLCSRHLSSLAASGGAILSSVRGAEGSQAPLILAEVPGRAPGGAIYALADGAVLRSTDEGRAWKPVNTPGRISAFLAATAETLLAASENALFQSIDGGTTWTSLEIPGAGAPIRRLVALSASSVAAIAGSRVLLSSDGSAWRLAASLPGNPAIHGIAGDGSKVLLAATSAGLMRSDDRGASWHSTGGNLRMTSIQAIARDPTHPRAYFAAAFGNAYESLDNGETWRRIAPEGPPIGPITQLLPSNDAERIFALTEARGVFVWNRAGPKF